MSLQGDNLITPINPNKINGTSSNKNQSARYLKKINKQIYLYIRFIFELLKYTSIKNNISCPFPRGFTVLTINAAIIAQKKDRHIVFNGK